MIKSLHGFDLLFSFCSLLFAVQPVPPQTSGLFQPVMTATGEKSTKKGLNPTANILRTQLGLFQLDLVAKIWFSLTDLGVIPNFVAKSSGMTVISAPQSNLPRMTPVTPLAG